MIPPSAGTVVRAAATPVSETSSRKLEPGDAESA
jgi:hypothetical protein